MVAVVQYGNPEMVQVPDIRHNGSELVFGVPISFAFAELGQPLGNAPTWYVASWASPGVAQLLIGGTDVPLLRGDYALYWRLSADPEFPARLSGRVSVR